MHSHHHGAVSFHKHAGLFSGAIIEYEDNEAQRIYDENLLNMKTNILVVHMIFGVDKSICDCTNEAVWSTFIEPIGDRGEVYSYCYEYCSFPEEQRLESDYVYDMESDIGDTFKLWLINGQQQPNIHDMIINRWRKIRLLNVMSQHYLQIQLPLQACQWFLIALDGIYLYENRPRDLSIPPYNGQFILPPAGRADIAVMCTDEGIFEVFSSQSNDDTELRNLPRMDDGILLFTLEINSATSQFNNLQGNDVVDLPNEFPPKPRYLDDLTPITVNDIEPCECISFDASTLDDNACTVQMRQTQGGTNHVINGLLFDPETPLHVLQFDQIYEFTLDLGSHVYHQHIYPFQLQENIGTGILGQVGDYFDTIGAATPFLMRTALYDFSGPMMIHCHNLPHEDLGMMSWANVVNELNTTSCSDDSPPFTTPHPSFQPTIYFTTAQPTESPSPDPTIIPTFNPTHIPTLQPTKNPTVEPTQEPTHPTKNPTTSPSMEPTFNPTMIPTLYPTINPTKVPTFNPTSSPTIASTVFVTTEIPPQTTVVVDGGVNNENIGNNDAEDDEQDFVTDNQEYESVFGIYGENAVIIDLIALIGMILSVIIIGIILIYCCCKRRKKYKGMKREGSPEPDAVSAVNIKDKSELQDSELAPVQV